eukprot:GHRR01027622.1.p2 GENE.GHRR01027622.1~~GHRR01027622.1.p2  ORF type:complete len:151 (+),score=53.08 GHRR01027622.1:1884-2336(+)
MHSGSILSDALAAAQWTIETADLQQQIDQAVLLYQSALEQLNSYIGQLDPAVSNSQVVQQFKEVLTRAETLKRLRTDDPAAAEYFHSKTRARVLAEKAVAADLQCQVAQALKLYFQLLEVLNKCHQLETEPEVKAAIMARFQVRCSAYNL